jgi:hypothetical protein
MISDEVGGVPRRRWPARSCEHTASGDAQTASEPSSRRRAVGCCSNLQIPAPFGFIDRQLALLKIQQRQAFCLVEMPFGYIPAIRRTRHGGRPIDPHPAIPGDRPSNHEIGRCWFRSGLVGQDAGRGLACCAPATVTNTETHLLSQPHRDPARVPLRCSLGLEGCYGADTAARNPKNPLVLAISP